MLKKVIIFILKLLNKNTLLKISGGLLIAFLIRYTVIHYQLANIDSIWWINNDYVFALCVSLTTTTREIVNRLIDEYGISREPFKYIADLIGSLSTKQTMPINKAYDNVKHMTGNTNNHINYMTGNTNEGGSAGNLNSNDIELTLWQKWSVICDPENLKGRLMLVTSLDLSDKFTILFRDTPIPLIKFNANLHQSLETNIPNISNKIKPFVWQYNLALKAQFLSYKIMAEQLVQALKFMDKFHGNPSLSDVDQVSLDGLNLVVRMLGPNNFILTPELNLSINDVKDVFLEALSRYAYQRDLYYEHVAENERYLNLLTSRSMQYRVVYSDMRRVNDVKIIREYKQEFAETFEKARENENF